MGLKSKLHPRSSHAEDRHAVAASDPAHVGEREIDAPWYDAQLGVYGPAFWAAILAAESERCSRYGRISTVVLVEVAGADLDGSHLGGPFAERAIRRVAPILTAAVRKSDFVARTGLRRFSVLLTETDEVAAINFVERVRVECNADDGECVATRPCAFGWAQATRSRRLTAAADAALSRLPLDLPT
jgi:diguanylate cyclase (GGDEF)-like protein